MKYLFLAISVFLLMINLGCNEDAPTNTNIQPGNDLIFADSGPSGAEVFLDGITTGKHTKVIISGEGSLPHVIGVARAIQNTRVAIYLSIEDWNFDITFAFTACDGNGNYTMSGIPPGVYYMDAWKDNDNNGIWGSSGDYIWWYGSGVFPNITLAPIQFPAGRTTVNFELFVVP